MATTLRFHGHIRGPTMKVIFDGTEAILCGECQVIMEETEQLENGSIFECPNGHGKYSLVDGE